MTAGGRPVLGVIGGSGLYDFEGLEDARRVEVTTPFGTPSDAVLTGRLGDLDVAFLPRHGRGHRLTPSEIDYRANIDALKRLGVTDLVSLSACGSFHEELAPGTFVVVDQFIDRTFARPKTFFGDGIVAHVSMAHPVCRRLGDALVAAAGGVGAAARRGGTYLAMEGPQFSTLAESNLYRAWGCDVIGMTNMPEAKLAREAEICYATVAMVTDYDCWHPHHGHVQVADILAVLRENAAKALTMVRRLAGGFGARPSPCPHGCDRVLDAAIVTPRAAWDPAAMARLSAVIGRVAGASGA
jgi:5'-methylthioadenosine phosphorylase